MIWNFAKLFTLLLVIGFCSSAPTPTETAAPPPSPTGSSPPGPLQLLAKLREKGQELAFALSEAATDGKLTKSESKTTVKPQKDTETVKVTEAASTVAVSPTTTATTNIKNRFSEDLKKEDKQPFPTVVKNEYLPMKDGAYEHTLELSDETIHKEIGKFHDGEFIIVGYFLYPTDKDKMHIYVKNSAGLNYYIRTINSGLDEYGIGEDEEEGEICSVTGNSCLDSRVLNSMIG